MKKILIIISIIAVNLHVFAKESVPSPKKTLKHEETKQLKSDKLKEPEYISERPDYTKLILINGEELVLVFDESGGNDTGYDTLYVDTNFNKNLTDDGAIAMSTKFFGANNVGFKMDETTSYKIGVQRMFKYERGLTGIKEKIHSVKINPTAVMMAEEKGAVVIKWTYSVNMEIVPSTDFNKADPVKIFDKKMKIRILSDIRQRGEQKYLNVAMKCVNGKNKSIPVPAITRAEKQVLPLLTIENEKGETIVSESLKPDADGIYSYSGAVPEAKTYKIKLNFDGGPAFGDLAAESEIKNLQVSSEKIAEPVYNSKEPEYAKIILEKGKELILVFDESGGTGTGHDTLYADTNFNKDLKDDDKYIGTENEKKFASKDINFKVEINADDLNYILNIVKREWPLKNNNSNSNKSKNKKVENFLNADVSMSEENGKWTYSNVFMLEPKGDFGRIIPIKIINKRIKFTVDSDISEQRVLNIFTECVDENNKETKIPAVMKDEKQAVPSITVEKEDGKVVIKANMKSGQNGSYQYFGKAPAVGRYKIKLNFDGGPLLGNLKTEKELIVE